MKLSTFALYAGAFFLSGAAATRYPIEVDGTHCRTGAGTSYSIKKTYSKDTMITISCQTPGETINGDNLWDKTQDGCYVSDYYIKTGTVGYVAPACGGSTTIPGPIVNDYPYSGSCSGVDKWNYYKCQCTSFVAWRINSRLNIKFTNEYKGYNWGNANTWDEAAKSTGVKINSTPVPGSIAQSNAGSAGHVAWVTSVDGNYVNIEEYNYVHPEAYGTRRVPKSDFNYIHIKV